MKTATTLLAAGLVIAMAVPVAGDDEGNGDGGGAVDNVAPHAATIGCDGENIHVGDTVTFTGTVTDANGEDDIASLTLTDGATSYTVSIGEEHASQYEPEDDGMPAAFQGAWKLWYGEENTEGGEGDETDGVLHFVVKHLYVDDASVAGLYTWHVVATDNDGEQYDSSVDDATCTDDVRQRIDVAADPVGGDGTGAVDANWGAWTAEPGATSVASSNYVLIKNTGHFADQQATVDFDGAFVGQDDTRYSIDILDNIAFKSAEVPEGEAIPPEGQFEHVDALGKGTTVTFNGHGNWIYVTYEIAQMPAVLADQTYQASYTVTPIIP